MNSTTASAHKHTRELRTVTLSGLDRVHIVAAVNLLDGAVFDWACYVGVGSTDRVAAEGDKLLKAWAVCVAATLWTDLDAKLYRE